MPAPTGQQWVRLYRGLANTSPDTVDSSRLGIHWTTDPNIAYNFATNRDAWGWSHHDEELPDPEGTVIEALVHRRHIIDPESQEGQDLHDWAGVLSPDSPEQEKTLRDKATVHLQRMHYINEETNKNQIVALQKGLRSLGRA